MADMVPVNSSNVVAIGYDEDSQSLFVQFKSGVRYQWEGIPPEVAAEFSASGSPGKYLYGVIQNEYGTGVIVP